MSHSVKDGKGGQVYVTESGRKRYVRKGRMFVELRTFKELLDPITKIKITQREDNATKCIVYFKAGNNLHLEEVVTKSSHGALAVEVRAALPLAGGVKSRRPERVKMGWNRTMPGRAEALGETGTLGYILG